MIRRTLWGLLVCGILGIASWAMAGVGLDRWESSTVTTAAGSVLVSVYTVPSGDGRPLNAARTSIGYPGSTAIIDATITLTLRDANGDPVPRFPLEDMWLQTTGGGLKLCPGGSVADSETDANGRTTFSHAVRGGGHSEGEQTVVFAGGYPVPGWIDPAPGWLNIQWNSPDITGDLKVDISDTVVFAGDCLHPSTYHYRSDLFYDSQVNLSDIVLYGQAVGRLCP